jgi:FkbM family methyltransferase
MMREFVNAILEFYLFPLRLSSRLAIYVKGLILRYDEHYLCTVDVVNKKFKDTKGVIIDIGAFNGDSAIFLAKKFPNVQVLAFEPNPYSFNDAVKLCGRYKNIELFNLGFSNISGRVDFYITRDSVSSSLLTPNRNTEIKFSSKINVEVETLDVRFNGVGDILLIKLDVQGSELRILEKGAQTLKKTKLILTEMLNSDLYIDGCQYYQVDEILRKNRFVLYSVFSPYNNEGTRYFDALYINGQYLQ